MTSSGTRIEVCGPLVVELGGSRVEERLPGRQGALVVAMLALGRDRGVARDELAAALWPAKAPADPGEALSALLSKVRRALGPEVLAGRQELRLAAPEPVVLDWDEVAAALQAAQHALAGGDAAAACAQAGRAAELAGRGFLTGHPAPWAHARREELEERRRTALATLAEAALRAGGPRLADAERAARDLVAVAPLGEGAHTLLMRALAARGETAEAQRVSEALRERLHAAGAAPGPLAAAVPAAPPVAAPDDALVGREHEQGELGRLIRDARLGASHALVVTGDPGIGKTELLRWAARAARADGMEVLQARGIESEAEVPFGGLLELLRPALGDLRRIPAEQATALRSALAMGPTHERDRFAIGAATLNLLSARSERAPLLVVVDDAQWLDGSSLNAILFAARRLVVDPVAVVFAHRTDAETPLAAARLPELALGGLDAAAARTLLARHAPAAAAPGVTDRLTRMAAGNPLALVELAAHAGELPAGEHPLTVATRVADEYTRRIAALAPRTRRALALAAAEASGALAPIGAAAERLGLALADLEPGERAGLVTLAFGTLGWRHPLARSAAYQAVTGDERRALHAALAAVLPDADADRRAWHEAAAALGPDETVARALAEAAGRARSRGAYASAAAAGERAAQLTPSQERRAERLLGAGEAAWLGGDGRRALDHLARARQLGPPTAVRAEIEHLRGQALIRAGDVMAGHEVLVAAAHEVERADPGKAVVMLAEATDACVYAGRPLEMREPAARAHALLPVGASDRERFFAALALGTALVWNGDPEEGADRLREAHDVLSGSEVLMLDPKLLFAAALAPLWLREGRTETSLLDRAIDVARESGALGALPCALMVAGREAATTDRWSLARALYDEAIDLARETGQGMPLCGALGFRATLQARTGETDAAVAGAQEGLRIAAEHGLELCGLWARVALAEVELAAGRLDGAARRLAELQDALTALGLRDPDLSPVPDLVEVAVRTGNAALPDELSDFADAAEEKGLPWSLARLARVRGLLAGPDDAERWFDAALEHHAATPDRFEEARTCLCRGERLRRAGRRSGAREPLRAALAAFEALGAAPWADRARAELLATGERARRRDPSTLDALTPQELQIGTTLAAGHTTREAAAKLFLSPKTVEYHLRNLYRKLGINSREDLAATLSDRGAGLGAPLR